MGGYSFREVSAPSKEQQQHLPIRVLLARARHEGCGGRAAWAQLLTGIDGVSSRQGRRIVLTGG